MVHFAIKYTNLISKIYLYIQVGTTIKILATTLVDSIFAIPTLLESNFPALDKPVS